MVIEDRAKETQDVEEDKAEVLADKSCSSKFIDGKEDNVVYEEHKLEENCNNSQEVDGQSEDKTNYLINMIVEEKEAHEESDTYTNFKNKIDYTSVKLKDVDSNNFSREFLVSLKNNPFFNDKVLNLSDLDCVLNDQDYESEISEIVKNFFESLNKVMEKDKKKDDKIKTENIYKRVQSVLNSLTPQNFNSKIQQIEGLAIDTEESLKGAIDLIFEKAIEEHEFSVAYAMMCKYLSSLQVLNLEGQRFNFKELLIKRCRSEFEKISFDKHFYAEKLNEVQNCTGTEENKKFQLNLEKEKRIIYDRSVGNIKFIGELFKQNILSCKAVHQYIKHLLLQQDEENLECLCILLSTVGKVLELKKVDLSPFFKKIQSLATTQKCKVSSHICSMLLDVIDLRARKWVSQSDNVNSKSADQPQEVLDLALNTESNSTINGSIKTDDCISDRKEENKTLSHGNSNSTPLEDPSDCNSVTIIQESLKIEDIIKTKNVWQHTWNTDSSEKKSENIYKKVRSVLNKLTPQKFTILVNQVQELEINTKERLLGVIHLVFEKAISEPDFSIAYAVLCRELSNLTVTDIAGTEIANFRKLLVNRCQSEFEKRVVDENARTQMTKEIEECTDFEKKKALQLNLEKEERMIHARSVGNIRFIGELFKLNMLTCKIMDQCIRHLLLHPDEENLECLCILLTTVGKVLEMKKVDLSIYFKKMQLLAAQKDKLSSRIRFMLLDVIDLRYNKWVTRRDNSNPKTIDQIQKEAEEEALHNKINNCLLNTLEKNDPDDTETDTMFLVVVPNEIFKNLVENYVREHILENSKGFDQAINTLQSTFPVPLHTRLTFELLNELLEKSEEHYYEASKVLSQLLLQEGITVKHFNAGLKKVFEISTDLIIDVPKLWNYLARLLACHVINCAEYLSELKSILQPPQESYVVLIAELMSEVCKLQGQKLTSDIWKKSKIKWADFYDDQKKIEQIVKQRDLNFLLGTSTTKNTAQVLIDRLIQYNRCVNNETEQSTKVLD